MLGDIMISSQFIQHSIQSENGFLWNIQFYKEFDLEYNVLDFIEHFLIPHINFEIIIFLILNYITKHIRQFTKL